MEGCCNSATNPLIEYHALSRPTAERTTKRHFAQYLLDTTLVCSLLFITGDPTSEYRFTTLALFMAVGIGLYFYERYVNVLYRVVYQIPKLLFSKEDRPSARLASNLI